MKLHTKTTVAALGALMMTLAPAIASAERVYFLVGVNHIYSIGPDRDLHLQDREEIEKKYADAVASDQAIFQKNVDGGADKDQESASLNHDLDQIAEERDQQLGSIFEDRTDLRDSHPELKIEGDGPYQVMGIEIHHEGETVVFDQYVVYAPWPGYVYVGAPYGGWEFERPYYPSVFISLYFGWHTNFYHGDRFYDGGFYGHGGRVHFAPRGFVRDFHSAYRPGRGYEHEVAMRHGGIYGGAHDLRRPGGFSGPRTAPGPRSPGGYGHAAPGASRAPGGYGHSQSEPAGRAPASPTISHGGYSHAATPSGGSSSTGGYGHAATGGNAAGGYSHAATPSGGSSSTGGYGHAATGGNAAGGYSHAATPSGGSSSTGGYGHAATGGNAAGGYSHAATPSGGSSSTGGYGHAATGGMAAGGYSHAATPSSGSSSTGGYGHSATGSSSSGGYNRYATPSSGSSSSGGYSRTSAPGSGSGSSGGFSRSSGGGSGSSSSSSGSSRSSGYSPSSTSSSRSSSGSGSSSSPSRSSAPSAPRSSSPAPRSSSPSSGSKGGSKKH